MTRRRQVSGPLVEILFLALPQGPHRRAQLLVTWGAGRWLSLVPVDWSFGLVVGVLLVPPAMYEVVILEPLPGSLTNLASVEPPPPPWLIPPSSAPRVPLHLPGQHRSTHHASLGD